MRGWRKHLILGFLLLGVVDCETNPAGPIVEPPRFSVGDRWNYTYDAALRDSLGAVINQYHDSIEVRVAAIVDSVAGLTGLVRMEARSLLSFVGSAGASGIESVWYQVSPTSLVEVAYRNAGAVPIVILSAAGPTGRLMVGSFFDPLKAVRSEINTDTTMIREDPRIVLKYPLKKGERWDSFRLPFLQTREIVAVEDIHVLGQKVSTARIRTALPDMSLGIEWNDWVSKRGLMRRILVVTVDSFDENLNPTGRMTHTESLELVAM